MNSNTDLFADQGAEFAPQPDRLEVVAGRVVATMNKPSAAQKRFNTLMARIDSEQALAAQLRHALDTHAPAHRQSVREMAARGQQLYKSMVMLLDARIQAPTKPKGLTANQKQQAIRMLLALCEQLEAEQDPDLMAVWERHAEPDEDEADPSEQARQAAQEMLASYMGEDFANGREFDSPEEMLRAAMEFEQQRRQAHEDKRQAKRAASKAKKPPTAREQAAAQKELDAQGALRAVFRQLASTLHPDREPDEQARKHKTALMSEVNAAYERQDLSALLRIQLQTELVDAGKAALLSEAKLKAMCDLLARQVKTLELDNLQLRHAIDFEFGYPSYQRFDEASLLAVMRDEIRHRQDEIAHMQADLQRVQDDKELKAWLREQTRLNKSQARYDPDFGLDIDDMLYAMMRQR